MALIIYSSGAVSEEMDRTALNQPGYLTELVGGDLENVTFTRPIKIDGLEYHAMLVNEDGKRLGLKYNHAATCVAARGGLIGDYIVGNAIFYRHGEIE